MYLLYLDGSGSIHSPTDDYVVLAGIAIHETKAHFLTSALDLLAEEVAPGEGADVEFHASAMLGGRGARWRGLTKEARSGLLIRALELGVRMHKASLFGAVVHKASISPDDPYEYAFEQIANRFDLFLRRLYLSGERHRGVLIVDDDAYEKRFQRLARDFRTAGHRWGKLANLAEVPLFVRSDASRLVQYADLVAFALFRHFQSQDDRFFRIIEGAFQGAKSDGLVHYAPKSMYLTCQCPSCQRRRKAMGPSAE